MSNLLAAMAGFVTVIFIWAVLKLGFKVDSWVSIIIAGVIGIIEFIVFRYILSQKYYPNKD